MVGSGTWKLANSHAEFAQLRPDWERLFAANSRHSPFMSWGWVDAWLRHIAREHELQVISWSDNDGDVQFILPLHRVKSSIGFRSKKLMLVCNYGLECSDNLGCLRADSLEDESAEMMAEAIQRFFPKSSSISLGFLDARYDFPRRLEQSIANHGRLVRVRPDAVCPAMDLPADWDEYLGGLSYSFRSKVRQSGRKITRDEPPHHKRVIPEQLDAFVHHLVRLNRTRMSAKGNTSSLEDSALREFFEDAIPSMVSDGLAWMDAIADGDKILGTALHFVHGKTVYYYMGGFDDSIQKLQPGTGLVAQVIQRAIDRGFTRYDHLRGDESYKYRWGASDVFTSNVTVYSSGLFRGRASALIDDLYLFALNALKDIRNRLQGRR